MVKGCIVCGHATNINQQMGGFARWANKPADTRVAEMRRIRAIGVAKQAEARQSKPHDTIKRPRGRPRKQAPVAGA